MSSRLLKVKDDSAKVITGVTSNSIGFYYVYYIGVYLPYDTTCRLSEFYSNLFDAKEALAAGEYVKIVKAVTYPNGLTLYYPAEPV